MNSVFAYLRDLGGANAAWIAVLLALAPLACREPFPPYDEPANVLTASLSLTSPDTVEAIVQSPIGVYLSSVLRFNVTETNNYDNLLSGPASIDGQIVVQSFGDVPRTCLLPIRLGDMQQPPVFQGNIAVAPDSGAQFTLYWFPLATDGKMVWEDLSYSGSNPRFYGPIQFVAYADVQVFTRIQAIRTDQIRFSLVFKVRYE